MARAMVEQLRRDRPGDGRSHRSGQRRPERFEGHFSIGARQMAFRFGMRRAAARGPVHGVERMQGGQFARRSVLRHSATKQGRASCPNAPERVRSVMAVAAAQAVDLVERAAHPTLARPLRPACAKPRRCRSSSTNIHPPAAKMQKPAREAS